MNKIDFAKIKLDYSKYNEITDLIIKNYAFNDGCILHPHWKKFSQSDYESLVKNKGLFKSLSWMGNGYPMTTEYRHPCYDKYNLEKFFENLNTIDIQSGIYQFYKIEELYNQINKFPVKNHRINILEIGGGYGRLAMFFLSYFGIHCHYISVDFVPTSLLFSPQVIKQSFPNMLVGDYNSAGNIEDYNFYSLPAWRINELKNDNYDICINIHSFQEMEIRSVNFYRNILWNKLKDSGMLFLINNPPEKDNWYTNHYYYNIHALFDEFYSNKYPIGEDWEKICGIPTLERAFKKGDPEVIGTMCKNCGHFYAMLEGDISSICPECGTKNINV
jgi:hypothetical protein